MKLPWVPSTGFDDPLCWLGNAMLWTPIPPLAVLGIIEPVAPQAIDPIASAVMLEMVAGMAAYLIGAVMELNRL